MRFLLYVQLLRRAVIAPGQPLTVGDVATCAPEDERALKTALPIPDAEGVWKVSAVAVARALTPAYAEGFTLLGESDCYVHVAAKKNSPHRLRAALAFILLTVGSALALSWFHADVNMLDAQKALFSLITGAEAQNPWLIIAPYTAGVGLGVGGYYALVCGRRTVSPLDVKLSDYRRSSEQTAARTP